MIMIVRHLSLLCVLIAFVAMAAAISSRHSQNRAITAVLQKLSDPDLVIQQKAQETLRSDPGKFLPLIKKRVSIRKKFPWLPERIAQVLGLDNSDYTPALRACMVLGPDALPALGSLAQLLQEEPSQHAAMALSAIGPEAIPMLTELLDHPWAEVRQASAMALARLFDRHAAETVPAASVDGAVSQLAVKLSDSETMVRAAAAYALLKLGPRASNAAPQLTVTISDAEPFVRNMAEKALLEVNKRLLHAQMTNAGSINH
jgi:hypothetical protein